jgi:integrase
MTALTTFVAREAVPALPAADLEIARDFARASKAAATRRAYQKDFARFTVWCAERKLSAVPATPRRSRHFSPPKPLGVRYAHKLTGHNDPPTSSEVVKATVHGIRRALGAAPVRKAPATADKVVAMAALADTDLKGLRDRAILLLGFAGAFRRSELVALDVGDLEFCESGMPRTHPPVQDRPGGHRRSHRNRVRLDRLPGEGGEGVARSGKDHQRAGVPADRQRGSDWHRAPRRSHRSRVVKASAQRVGLDPNLFAGQSLRSGFLTSAAGRGASIFKMMDVSRHKSMGTLRGYVRDAELFRDHAGACLCSSIDDRAKPKLM